MDKYEQYARQRAEHFKQLGDWSAAIEWANTAHRYYTYELTKGRSEAAQKERESK